MTPRPLDPATTGEKLRLLEELVDALRSLSPVSGEQLRTDVVVRLAVERALTQAVDLVVSVCGHVLSAEDAPVPGTYREVVSRAAAGGLLEEELGGSLGRAVGVRNLLVHRDGRVDLDLVAAAVPTAVHDLASFITQVAGWLQERTRR